MVETPVVNEVTENNFEMQPQKLHSSTVAGLSTMSFISPKQFMPPLKASPRSSNRKVRKPGKSRMERTLRKKMKLQKARRSVKKRRLK